MTKDNTPSGETVGTMIGDVEEWCGCWEGDIGECFPGKKISFEHSLRQAIEGMVERIIGEDQDPNTSGRGFKTGYVTRENKLRAAQRQRAKEEISKLFGKE